MTNELNGCGSEGTDLEPIIDPGRVIVDPHIHLWRREAFGATLAALSSLDVRRTRHRAEYTPTARSTNDVRNFQSAPQMANNDLPHNISTPHIAVNMVPSPQPFIGPLRK